MTSDNQLFNWSLIYFAELLAFSVAFLFLVKRSILIPVVLWTVSNLLAAFAMVTPSVFVETTSSSGYNLLNYVMSGTSILLPYFALAIGRAGRFHFHKSLIVIGVAVLTLMMAAFLPYGWLPSAIGYTSGAAIVFATAWVCFKNRLWRGLWGQSILLVGLTACAVLLLWRGWIVFDGRVGTGFDVPASKSILGLQLMVFASLFIQVGFLALIVGRELRSRLFLGRRAARLFEVSRGLIADQKRLAALADERLLTLSLLTHEVRQPINNARAALEALDYAVKPDSPNAAKSKLAIGRAQAVLDTVTLSISNAILGASLLEEHHQIAPRSVNARDIAELAITDCPLALAPRIDLNCDGESVYVDLDPILIRLALRNLLDNALKYSPVHSRVQLQILQQEDLLGTSFRVTSQTNKPDLLSGDIFLQRTRGVGAQGDGSGLGLYLVKKVAEAHNGTISYAIHDETMVTFDLFIPD